MLPNNHTTTHTLRFRKDTLHLIDNEIANLNEAIRALRTRRNSFVSISCLPAELLGHVFSYVAHDGDTNLEWIVVSHVCRLWRDIAIGCADLWSNIPVWSPQWMREMLVRSKGSPLVIHADMYISKAYPTVDAITLLLKQHGARARELRITAPVNHLLTIFEEMNFAAPILESLYLCAHNNTVSKKPSLPRVLLCNATPRLRTLRLRSVGLTMDSPLLSSLTHLEVHSLFNDDAPSLPELLELLVSLPQLRTLRLLDALPAVPENTPFFLGAHNIVTLPALRRLHISGNTPECAFLLVHLRFTPTALLKVVCRDWTFRPDFTSIFPILSAHIQTGEPLRTVFVERVHQERPVVRLQAWTSIFEDKLACNASPLPRIDVWLDWSRYSYRLTFERGMASLCAALPLAQVRNVHIFLADAGELEFPPAIWREAFGNAMMVDTLHVTHAGIGIFSALMEHTVDNGEISEDQMAVNGFVVEDHPPPNAMEEGFFQTKQSYSPLFPGLQKLVLDGVVFQPGSTTLDVIRRCLQERTGVRELHLRMCANFTEREKLELQCRSDLGVYWDEHVVLAGDDDTADESDVYDDHEESLQAFPGFVDY